MNDDEEYVPSLEMHGDAVRACAHLANRGGAIEFEIGYVRDGVPVEEAGWYAVAKFQGAELRAEEHRSPTGAALALAERILRGAQCRCFRPVTLSDGRPDACRWTLNGARWQPGCDAPPVKVSAGRGDVAAMERAMDQARRGAAQKGRHQ